MCDVTISLPYLVGAEGVLASFPLPLSQDEEARLQASAAMVCGPSRSWMRPWNCESLKEKQPEHFSAPWGCSSGAGEWMLVRG